MPENGDQPPLRFAILILLIMMLSGAAIRLPLLIEPMPKLVGHCLADDAFYYFQIARNIVNGQGSTFDGLVRTNGYHPLYMGLLLPIFSLWPDGGEAPIRVALFLLALAWLATAVPVYLIGRELGGERTGLWAAGFFCLNPFGAVISGMGVEAPLAGLALALASWWHLTRVRARPEAGLGRSIVLGALMGLAVLSRTDSGLFCIVLGLDLVLSMRRKPSAALKHGLVAAAVAFSMFAPWLIWSKVNFGHFGQDSGAAIFVLTRHELGRSGLSTWAYIMLKLREGLDENLVQYLGLRGLEYSPYGGYHDLVLWAALGALAAIHRVMAGRSEHVPWRGAFIFLGAGAIWLFYAAVFWSQRLWYHVPTMLALSLAGALLVSAGVRSVGKIGPVVLTLLVAVHVIGSAKAYADIHERGVQPWQEVYIAAARDLGGGRMNEIGPDEPVGAFNAGILAYVSGRRVINLDGVVNAPASAAIRRGQIDVYLQEQGIDFIIDHADLIASFSDRSRGPWQGFERIRTYRGFYVVARAPWEDQQ